MRNEYSPEFKQEFANKFNKYIDETENPSLLEFCVLNDVLRETASNWEPVKAFTKKAKAKQELWHQGQLRSGKNPVAHIFLLKCLHKYRENDPQPIDNTKVSVTVSGKTGKAALGEMHKLINSQAANNRERKKPKVKR